MKELHETIAPSRKPWQSLKFSNLLANNISKLSKVVSFKFVPSIEFAMTNFLMIEFRIELDKK